MYLVSQAIYTRISLFMTPYIYICVCARMRVRMCLCVCVHVVVRVSGMLERSAVP